MRRGMVFGMLAGLALVLWPALVPDGADAQGPGSGSAGTIDGLRVEVSATLLNPDGSFIPPERRLYEVVATWNRAPGFTGRYEVEWARQRRGEGGLSYSPVTVVEASAAVNGVLRVAENITFADAAGVRWCYRVRAITTGAPAPGSPAVGDIGSWAEACSALPPSSGPAPLAAPPAARMGNWYERLGSSPEFVTIVRFGWVPVPGFAGSYQVERAYVTRYDAQSTVRDYSLLATVSSPPGADGWIEFEERVPYVTMWDNPPCYRVRAIRGDERGPYSAERCAFLPTDTRPPAGRLPLAPDAGSGAPTASLWPSSTTLPGVLLIGAGALAGIWSARSRRRH